MTIHIPKNLIEAIQVGDAPTIIAFAQFATSKTLERAQQLLEKWDIERVISLMHEAQQCDKWQFFALLTANFA